MANWRDSYRTRSANAGPVRADQLASTFSDTAFHGYCNTPHGHAGVGSDDLIDPVWLAARVVLWAIHLVAKPGDGLSVYIVQWRAADYLAAVISRVSNNDYLEGHGNLAGRLD
jgi:hypothetical protein